MNENIKRLQADLGLKPDGLRGPVTTSAILAAADEGRLGVKAAPSPVIESNGVVPFLSPSYDKLDTVFGKAGGPECTEGRVELPFYFRIAWDVDQHVSKVSCHKKVAASFTSIWSQAANHYGEKKFRELGLDLFGGCFNYRPMRGGTKLSTHAYGIAWDTDPARNQLRWSKRRASLAWDEFIPFWNIVEAHGAYSLGRAFDYDWMHFQFCKP